MPEQRRAGWLCAALRSLFPWYFGARDRAARVDRTLAESRRERDELSRRMAELRASIRTHTPLREVRKWP